MAIQTAINGIRVIIAEDSEEMSRIASNIILEKQRQHNRMKLLVPTGTTPEGVYRILREKGFGLSEDSVIFNMDEYACRENGAIKLLPSTHPASYAKYMDERLFSHLSPVPKHFFPDAENVSHPGSYDLLIERHGGINLCINGVGEDGHIFGFNLPGKGVFSSVTRLVKLSASLKAVNQRLTDVATPDYAITIGVKTGMSSKEIITLAFGERKADVLRRVLFSESPTESLPATILKTHKNASWIMDRAAASRLNITCSGF